MPDADPATRTLPVRIVIENPEHKLAPGMFVSIDCEARAGEAQLVVPSKAEIVTGERSGHRFGGQSQAFRVTWPVSCIPVQEGDARLWTKAKGSSPFQPDPVPHQGDCSPYHPRGSCKMVGIRA